MRILILAVLTALLVGCSDTDDIIGTIMFTSNADCSFRLFDSNGRQLAGDVYELGKPPTVVNMKSNGVFIIQAESTNKEIKEPIVFHSGNLEYYIEF